MTARQLSETPHGWYSKDMEEITEAITKENTEKTGQNLKVDKRKSLPHLFKKGKDWKGNKNGRPVGTVSVTEAVKRKLLEVFPASGKDQNKEKKLYLDKLVERILENGIQNGETRTQKDIWNYMDGQPKTTIDIGADKESLADLTEFFRAIGKKKK